MSLPINATGVLIFALLSVEGAKADELTNYARTAHRSSVEAIRQFSCRVECQHWQASRGSTTLKRTGQYWRDGDRARAIETNASGEVRDLFLNGTVIKSLEHEKDRRMAAGGIHPLTKQNLTDCDAYAQALFRLPLPNTIISVPLDQLLNDATRLGRAEKRTIEGREQIVLHFESEKPYLIDLKWKVAVILDASVNHLVRRVTYEHTSEKNGAKLVRDHRVVDFHEVAPSIFFPAKAVCEVAENGKLRTRQEVTFTDVVINRPLAPNTFAFRFPYGLLIGDSIRHGKRTSLGTHVQ
jgi:hypothetical protein